jgi:DNA polymerase (family 10)
METVKDIDLLAGTNDPDSVSELFAGFPGLETVIAGGTTKTSIKLDTGINADLRVVTPEQYPYALHHFTGSREHNTAMRARAKKRGYKMNEYGLFQDDQLIPCDDEHAIFQRLGLAYIAPELRENLGEIDAAESGTLPKLIEEKDIQGIFHVHSNYSDGSNTIEELVRAVRDRGWKYLGIADHSKSAAYAGGLTEKDILAQYDEIDRFNSANSDIRIFKGIESDILPNGDLDYPESILQLFDFVIASVHSNFRLPRDEMTNRVIKAMHNPYTTMLGHPTGRLLLSREPYEIDLDRILAVAAENDVIIEINSHPYRLDLDWREIKKAKSQGILLSINPDAHNTDGFEDYRYGTGIARKGWLSKNDVLNCMDTDTVEQVINRRKL